MWRPPAASTRRRSTRALARARPLSRALRDHEGLATFSCWRPPPRAMPTNGPAFLAAAAKACGQRDRTPVGRRGSATLRAGRRLGLSRSRTASSATWAAAASNWSTSSATASGEGITMPLGGLALQDMSGGSLKKAQKIVRAALERAPEHLEQLAWADVLRGRRHLARAGAAASGCDRLPAACDARLYDRPARTASISSTSWKRSTPRR